ncbi:MAG: efflux RND transporter permease subunit [Candidatus Omnitrophica bacterium]|nr:efflux RND transporter permease subunit [Candidatus Omnitrophota bacterium]MBU1995649.1 efflux RND transporter permease subunit [Candidatus Omnitrophota bacterium]MBU4332869.1 efflux RND transporter permease subunit [Candidatus Omnitrophota bacterium]
MVKNIIEYFVNRHRLTNIFCLMVLVGGVFSWFSIPKEQLPDISFDIVRISTSYPGASAEEVEKDITIPIEDELQGVDGIHSVISSSSRGSSSIRVELEPGYPDKNEAIADIKNAVSDVDLPIEIREDPSVQVFKTSKRAIIDIAIYLDDIKYLDKENRQKLQSYMFSLEDKLLSMPQVNSIGRSGYLKEEIQIIANPEKLYEYRVSLNSLSSAITKNNISRPAGSLDDEKESKVVLDSELNTADKINDLTVQGGFEGKSVRISDLGIVRNGYEDTSLIMKVNGYQGIILNVVKNSQYGILDSIDTITQAVANFENIRLKDTNVKLVLLDDESTDVRNRLSLIGINGFIGFVIIVLLLMIFLDLTSGFWVAIGIPFTFCTSIILMKLSGMTINNTTLAGVIIVMGMVVDDAIVVAENVARLKREGVEFTKAAIEGTCFVFKPILASILTTCVAFIPLFFFQGRFGKMVSFIPPIIFFMLGASLLEAIIVLPGHMSLTRFPFRKKKPSIHSVEKSQKKQNWFIKIETSYEKLLLKLLKHKIWITIVFISLLALSLLILKFKMSFVMFPDEETREARISGEMKSNTTSIETAKVCERIESVLQKYLGNEVVGFRTQIARSHFGSAAKENRFNIGVEIVQKEKRKKSADILLKEWENQIEDIKGDFKKITFSKSRFGHDSGSQIEVNIRENNNVLREKVMNTIVSELEAAGLFKNIETGEPLKYPEYRVEFLRDEIKRLDIDPSVVSDTFRTAVQGSVLFDFKVENEDMEVILSIPDEHKDTLEKILAVPAENKRDYLVPLKSLVTYRLVDSPDSIDREDRKRTVKVYADLKKESKMTPLEAAVYLEGSIFPKIQSSYPSVILDFTGEIKDSRDSGKDFVYAVILTLLLIFFILLILFDSLTKPLIIMLSIPFGAVGVIFAFWLHGIVQYGFFAVIGAIGLAGVVVNDSIVMLAKMDIMTEGKKFITNLDIANAAATRLRAVILTTLTTVAGVFPTAYGFAGYDAMLGQMMLVMCWGLLFATGITLVLVPCIYSFLYVNPNFKEEK